MAARNPRDTGADTAVDVTVDIAWDRLRPLDSNPALNSRQPLLRAGAPGETVVVRRATGTATPQRPALRRGQFLVCIDNTATGDLIAVDGPGQRWQLPRDAVNATCGFPAHWLAHDRDFLVWAYSRDTIIFRESLRNGYEGNFFYLLLSGEDRPDASCLLIDSGTGWADPRPYVMPLVGRRRLYVLSTHSHWDHFGGHRHFRDCDNVVLLGHQPGAEYDPDAPGDLSGLIDFFQLRDWPQTVSTFALGERQLSIIPQPGHTADCIAVYDHSERLLFSSDSIYPGLLLIQDWPAAAASMRRLASFCAAHPPRWVLGSHIEMSQMRPWNGRYEYFHFGSNSHWDEHALQLPADVVNRVARQVQRRLREGAPRYDARAVEQEFHRQPFQLASMAGIAPNYRRDNDRLVELLRLRHRRFDALRRH